MKPHERRQHQAYPYFKVATFDPRSMTFRDGKQAFTSEQAALASIPGPGKYRLSVVTDTGRQDRTPFEVGERIGGD